MGDQPDRAATGAASAPASPASPASPRPRLRPRSPRPGSRRGSPRSRRRPSRPRRLRRRSPAPRRRSRRGHRRPAGHRHRRRRSHHPWRALLPSLPAVPMPQTTLAFAPRRGHPEVAAGVDRAVDRRASTTTPRAAAWVRSRWTVAPASTPSASTDSTATVEPSGCSTVSSDCGRPAGPRRRTACRRRSWCRRCTAPAARCSASAAARRARTDRSPAGATSRTRGLGVDLASGETIARSIPRIAAAARCREHEQPHRPHGPERRADRRRQVNPHRAARSVERLTQPRDGDRCWRRCEGSRFAHRAWPSAGPRSPSRLAGEPPRPARSSCAAASW